MYKFVTSLMYILGLLAGGQNVQKVATKVELRFHLDSATWLTEEIKEKFRQKHSLTKDGYFIVKSGENITRSFHHSIKTFKRYIF